MVKYNTVFDTEYCEYFAERGLEDIYYNRVGSKWDPSFGNMHPDFVVLAVL